MNFEQRVLQLVKSVTDISADFYNGTLFLETEDSEIATKVYNVLYANLKGSGIIFGKCASGETSYDFI